MDSILIASAIIFVGLMVVSGAMLEIRDEIRMIRREIKRLFDR